MTEKQLSNGCFKYNRCLDDINTYKILIFMNLFSEKNNLIYRTGSNSLKGGTYGTGTKL